MENINVYLKSITEISDKKLGNIEIKSLSIQKIIVKYSSQGPIFKLILNEKVISKNNNLIVTYICQACKITNSITCNIFMRKINKDNFIGCNFCKNLDPIKRSNHKEFFKNKINNPIVIIKEKNVKSFIDESQILWDSMDDDFKDSYQRKYLTNFEFERIKHLIISVQHDKIFLDDYEYVFNCKINNGEIFHPRIVNYKMNMIDKIIYIKFKCENCDLIFFNKDLYTQKNKLKILCNNCNFTNKTFKIRSMLNFKNEKILYQSLLEKRFIEFCNSNKINLTNGPTINYFFKKESKYKVDFLVNNILLELKDNHIWYKRELESGKHLAKMEAAKKYALENSLVFKLVFQKDIQVFKNDVVAESPKQSVSPKQSLSYNMH